MKQSVPANQKGAEVLATSPATPEIPKQPAREQVLYLHVGAGKTGTSALQSALARNAIRLRESGIFYPDDPTSERAKAGLVTSGNGVALAKYLGVQFGPSADFIGTAHLKDEVIAAHRGGYNLLYSSETLSEIRPDLAGEFVAFANEVGYKVRVIAYFRAIADHAISIYHQTIKQGETRLSLADFISQQYGSGQLGLLENLLRIFHPTEIIARNYDMVANNLVMDFLANGLGLETQSFDTASDIVNRSLTDTELVLMRTMNPLFKSSLQAFVASGALIYGLPDAKRSYTISSKAMQAVETLHANDLTTINAFLLATPITLRSAKLLVSDAPEPELSETERALAVMIAGIIRATGLDDVMR